MPMDGPSGICFYPTFKLDYNKIFYPFEDWGNSEFFGLCIKDGSLFEPNPSIEYDYMDYLEFHISLEQKDIWVIDIATADNAGIEVYRGKIPSRKFFCELLKNFELGFDIEKL